MKGGHGPTNYSYLTVIVVHSTMYLMRHNHCQITIIIIMCVCMCICACMCVYVCHYVYVCTDLKSPVGKLYVCRASLFLKGISSVCII